MLSSKRRNDLVEAARSLINVPWRHRGVTATGVDCIGLVVYAAKRAGVIPEDTKLEAYSTYPRPELLYRELPKFADRTLELQPGNFIFFGRTNLVHIALLSGPNSFIHADRNVGRVSEVPWTAPWDKYPYTIWEFR